MSKIYAVVDVDCPLVAEDWGTRRRGAPFV